ncbi:MAG: nucleoside deaminase [Motiliproteus sp.]
MESVEALQQQLEKLQVMSPQSAAEFTHQQLGLRCCELALQGLQQGCYGVGAVLTDGQQSIVAEGVNRVFSAGYHSSAHAEMQLLDAFERTYRDYGDRSELTLMVSLEPCPMCLVRSMLAGIGHIRYLVADADGGMVSRLEKLPPAWRNLASLQSHHLAHISPELRQLSTALASYDLAAMRKKVMANIRGQD